jgi:predicted dehydrogenase
MRIGLLGSGAMGQQHLAAYATLSGVEVVTRDSAAYAGVDPYDRDALQRAMITDPTLDAIDICLPTTLHPRVAIAALEAGKHVLCEKPLALTEQECSCILSSARQSGRVFMVAHVLRFFPAYRSLGEAVQTLCYGPVEHIRFTRSSGIPTWAPWLAHMEESGGAVLDLLVHDFDQSIALFGMPIDAVVESLESDHTVRCVLHYAHSDHPNGLVVEITGGWFGDSRPFSMGFHARFRDAELIFRDNRLSVLRPAALPQELSLPDVDPYTEQLRYFIECCRSHSEPLECPPESSAAAVTLALAVSSLAQAESGKLTALQWS